MAWRGVLYCCLMLLPGLPLRVDAGAPVRVFTSELPPMSMATSALGTGAMHEMVAELGRRTGEAAGVSAGGSVVG